MARPTDNAMGIDASLGGFAFCVLCRYPHHAVEQQLKSKPADTVAGRIARYRSLVLPTLVAVHEHQPRIVVIEGYSHGSQGRATLDLAELGGILRMSLLEAVPSGCQIVECAPATLKKFAAGKGNADKSEVVSALSRRYDRTFKSNDQADAFALAVIGQCLLGVEQPENQAQRDAVKTLQAKMAA